MRPGEIAAELLGAVLIAASAAIGLRLTLEPGFRPGLDQRHDRERVHAIGADDSAEADCGASELTKFERHVTSDIAESNPPNGPAP